MSVAESLARGYLRALSQQDGPNGAKLFAHDAVIDDFSGGHWVGRDTIEYFLNFVPPGLLVDAPQKVIEEHDGRRVTCYGTVGIPGWGEPTRVRWTFVIENGEILHLCNSATTYLYGLEMRPSELNPKELS